MIVKFIVNNDYILYGATGTTIFNVPMYNQDYVINLSYPDTAFDNLNFTELEFADLSLAYSTDLITTYTFNWDGLDNDEKIVFDNFIKSFYNSFKPFTLQVYDSSVIWEKTFIISSETIQVSQDKYGLWKISISLIEYNFEHDVDSENSIGFYGISTYGQSNYS